MVRLTVVFDYPDEATMQTAKNMFDEQGKKGSIPNLVGTCCGDAIDDLAMCEGSLEMAVDAATGD